MSFAKLIAKVTVIANHAVDRKAADLAGKIAGSAEISVEQRGHSINLIGKKIRRRFITDANFRRRLR